MSNLVIWEICPASSMTTYGHPIKRRDTINAKQESNIDTLYLYNNNAMKYNTFAYHAIK